MYLRTYFYLIIAILALLTLSGCAEFIQGFEMQFSSNANRSNPSQSNQTCVEQNNILIDQNKKLQRERDDYKNLAEELNKQSSQNNCNIKLQKLQRERDDYKKLAEELNNKVPQQDCGKQFNELIRERNDYKYQLEELQTNQIKQEELLSEYRKSMDNLKKEKSDLIQTQSNLSEEINNFRKIKSGIIDIEREIEILKEENDKLKIENKKLKANNQKLNIKLSNYQKEIQRLSQTR